MQRYFLDLNTEGEKTLFRRFKAWCALKGSTMKAELLKMMDELIKRG